MTNYEELELNEEKIQIISKKMIVIALISPFSFGVLGIIIGYLVTLNKAESIQRIALVAGAFIGLLISIILIFVLQRIINKRLRVIEDKGEKKNRVDV